MVSPLAATKAYAAIQKIASTPPSVGEVPNDAGASFSDLVRNAINQAVDSTHHAEAAMTAHTKGKTDLIDVVTAVSDAQTSLQTVMAVRDQVISAYQQIQSMQI